MCYPLGDDSLRRAEAEARLKAEERVGQEPEARRAAEGRVEQEAEARRQVEKEKRKTGQWNQEMKAEIERLRAQLGGREEGEA